MRPLILLALFATTARADGYSMADLEILDKQEAWDELGRHLDDVPPTKRDARWQTILERTAVGSLVLRAAQPVLAYQVAEQLTKRFPTVKRSKDFMARRTTVGLAGLEACLQRNTEDCGARFLDYVDADPTNQPLAVKAGIQLAGSTKPAVAVAFFKRGLAGRKNAKECADKAVDRAVRAALELPADNPRVADANELAGAICWDALAESLVEQLVRGGGGAYRHNACPLLLQKKVLSAV